MNILPNDKFTRRIYVDTDVCSVDPFPELRSFDAEEHAKSMKELYGFTPVFWYGAGQGPFDGVFDDAFRDEIFDNEHDHYPYDVEFRMSCPRRVVDMTCRYDSLETIWYTKDCDCDVFDDILDHSSLWRTRKGQIVYVAEPFGLVGKNLRVLINRMEEIGIDVDVRAESPYFPGLTTLVLLRPAGYRE